MDIKSSRARVRSNELEKSTSLSELVSPTISEVQSPIVSEIPMNQLQISTMDSHNIDITSETIVDDKDELSSMSQDIIFNENVLTTDNTNEVITLITSARDSYDSTKFHENMVNFVRCVSYNEQLQAGVMNVIEYFFSAYIYDNLKQKGTSEMLNIIREFHATYDGFSKEIIDGYYTDEKSRKTLKVSCDHRELKMICNFLILIQRKSNQISTIEIFDKKQLDNAVVINMEGTVEKLLNDNILKLEEISYDLYSRILLLLNTRDPKNFVKSKRIKEICDYSMPVQALIIKCNSAVAERAKSKQKSSYEREYAYKASSNSVISKSNRNSSFISDEIDTDNPTELLLLEDKSTLDEKDITSEALLSLKNLKANVSSINYKEDLDIGMSDNGNDVKNTKNQDEYDESQFQEYSLIDLENYSPDYADMFIENVIQNLKMNDTVTKQLKLKCIQKCPISIDPSMVVLPERKYQQVIDKKTAEHYLGYMFARENTLICLEIFINSTSDNFLVLEKIKSISNTKGNALSDTTKSLKIKEFLEDIIPVRLYFNINDVQMFSSSTTGDGLCALRVLYSLDLASSSSNDAIDPNMYNKEVYDNFFKWINQKTSLVKSIYEEYCTFKDNYLIDSNVDVGINENNNVIIDAFVSMYQEKKNIILYFNEYIFSKYLEWENGFTQYININLAFDKLDESKGNFKIPKVHWFNMTFLNVLYPDLSNKNDVIFLSTSHEYLQVPRRILDVDNTNTGLFNSFKSNDLTTFMSGIINKKYYDKKIPVKRFYESIKAGNTPIVIYNGNHFYILPNKMFPHYGVIEKTFKELCYKIMTNFNVDKYELTNLNTLSKSEILKATQISNFKYNKFINILKNEIENKNKLIDELNEQLKFEKTK
jgi:hypothetical protein